ncbi:MAG TPA: TonB family protein [Methylomirabilota bacterium]|nr:TonB family protein [Methylomirabilota bacterium]
MKFLPEDRTNRNLVVTVLVSLLLHALIGVALLLSGGLSGPVIANRGEPLFVDIAPDKPKEAAPLGNPARPPGPDVAESLKPRPVAPPAVKSPPSPPARPVSPAPRVAEAPKPAPRAPEPREVAKPAPPPVPPTPKGEEPAYEGRSAQALPQTPKAAPEPQPQPQQPSQQPPAPSPGSEPRVASVPQPASPPGMYRKPGGGGGFQGGQGGVVGQPVPLDTPDPNYREYMLKVRQRIYANWGYPYEAQTRGLHGKLVIEFHIAKDGQLLKAEIVESSGENILDTFALNAVKLAQRYPPLPDAMRRDVLPVIGIFVYSLRSAQSSVFQLLQ